MRELDAGPWSTARHIAGEHASLLTAVHGLADLAELNRDRFEVVGVTGNSMGFYTALVAAGALDLVDGLTLVETMGAYQADNVIGGQILYPVTNPDWQPDDAARLAVDAAMARAVAAGHAAALSIDLVGYVVIGADEAGCRALMASLPPVERGGRTFPTLLPLHSAFHTPLLQSASDRARDDLAHLGWRDPVVDLVDGRGHVHRPHSTAPDALAAYTLGHQVVAPYNLTVALRTALQHCAPDVVVALGPGNSLGGPIARALVTAGWRGLRTRDDFDRAQASDEPALLAFGVSLQRPLLQ